MQTQRLVMLAGAALLFAMSSVQAAEQNNAGPDRAKLIGAWHIVSMEELRQDGRLEHHTDRTGMIVFTADGHFSVQVMYPESGGADSANPTYARDGYEGTFGSYSVDEQAHTISQHVQAALVRTLIGKDLLRLMQFSSDGYLTLRSARPEEKWSVTWEHD